MWIIGQVCDIGQKRKGSPNQDSIGGLTPASGWKGDPLLVVADGMGGYTGGADASRIVVQTLLQDFQKNPADPAAALRASILKGHGGIRTKGSSDPDLQSMGSTVVAAVLQKDRLLLANVGDSRAYRIRDGQISQISYDHSKVAELLRHNLITPEQAATHPQKSHLTMSISAQRDSIDPYQAVVDILPQDVILLCSDGLWGVVPEEVIAGVAQNMPPQQAAARLAQLANQYGGPDNISVIIARQQNPPKGAKVDLDATQLSIPAAKKKMPAWLWGMLAGLLVIILLIIFLLLRINTRNGDPAGPQDIVPVLEVQPTEQQQIVVEPTPELPLEPIALVADISPLDEMSLIFIPGGVFQMGSEEGLLDELPVHSVTLSPYWMDQTEVTNTQYALCVQAGVCSAPQSGDSATRLGYYTDPAYTSFPVVNITWQQAFDYCQWAGRRLPTEAEWEFAARGVEGRTYPWGNSLPTHSLANYGTIVTATQLKWEVSQMAPVHLGSWIWLAMSLNGQMIGMQIIDQVD